jgi:hypothetical protein
MAEPSANNPQQGEGSSRKRACPELSTDDLIRQAQQLAGESDQGDPSHSIPPLLEKFVTERLKLLQKLLRARHSCIHGIARMEEQAKANVVCKPFRFTVPEVWMYDEEERKSVNEALCKVMEKMKQGMHETLYEGKKRDLEKINAEIASWLDASRGGVHVHLEAYRTLVPPAAPECPLSAAALQGLMPPTTSTFAAYIEELQASLQAATGKSLATGMLDELNRFIEWRMAEERRISQQKEKRQQREAAQADAEMLPVEEGVSEITRRVVAEELKKLNIKELMHELRRLTGSSKGGTGDGGGKPKRKNRGSKSPPSRSAPQPRTPAPRHVNSPHARVHGDARMRANAQPTAPPFGNRPTYRPPANGAKRDSGGGGNRSGGRGGGNGGRMPNNHHGTGHRGTFNGAHNPQPFFPPAHAYMQPYPPYPFAPAPPPFLHPMQPFPGHFLPMEPPGPAPHL